MIRNINDEGADVRPTTPEEDEADPERSPGGASGAEAGRFAADADELDSRDAGALLVDDDPTVERDDVIEPERKRTIIGETFWREFAAVAHEHGDPRFFVQGTLYPDVVESGSHNESNSTIKSHHNLVAFPEGLHFELVEPLRQLFKDEVRALGEQLGLPEEIVWRQPFPGPGLGVRIIGTVTRERLEILRAADRQPILEIGDAQRGIQLAQMVHRAPRFVRSAGKRMACRDDADHHQEGRQIPECLLRP